MDDNCKTYVAEAALAAALAYALIGITVVAILVACYFGLYSLIVEQHVYRFAVLGFIAGVATLFAIARALIVKIDAPAGRAITREEAPELFTAIDDVLHRMAVK